MGVWLVSGVGFKEPGFVSYADRQTAAQQPGKTCSYKFRRGRKPTTRTP